MRFISVIFVKNLFTTQYEVYNILNVVVLQFLLMFNVFYSKLLTFMRKVREGKFYLKFS